MNPPALQIRYQFLSPKILGFRGFFHTQAKKLNLSGFLIYCSDVPETIRQIHLFLLFRDFFHCLLTLFVCMDRIECIIRYCENGKHFKIERISEK